MASNTPDSSIAALEQQIQDLETKISNVETKADQAEAKGDPEGLRFYRAKEQQLRREKEQLRRKEEQLREEKARKEAAQDKDWTERKIADLLSPRLIHTPDLEGLRRIMGSGLGPDGKGCLPLHAAELAAITAGQPSLADKLEDMSLSHAVALASHVAVALRRGYTLGDEISLAGAFDNVFRSTLAFIATNQGGTTMNLRMVRNSSEDSATLKRMRPDFGLQVRSALLLKGEDKTAYTHMRVAEAELIEKMREWSVFYHGKVPYMLAYAQAEGLVRFHAILRERPGELQRLHPHEINANTVYGRIQLLTCAFHIFRILEVLQKELPEEVRPLNTEVTRSNGTRILYFADNVRKQMPAGEQGIDPPRLAVLQDIYNRTKGCQHVITAMTPPQLEMSRGEGPIYRVYLHPVGMGLGPHYPGMPQTEAELATAVWCILQGLRSIHATGFGHGDLRWENVILVPPRRYILIDLESVIKLGSKVQLPYPAAFESGQSLSRDGRYTEASDLYSLGAMMEASQVPLSVQGESFVGELKASRVKVSVALQNGWLQQRQQ